VHRLTRLAAAAVTAFLFLISPARAAAGEPHASVISDPAALLGGPRADGQLGDILLTNGDISIIIEAVDHPHGDAQSGGNMIDAAPAPTWSDEIGHVTTILGPYPGHATYDTVRIENEGSRGEAVVLARGSASGTPQVGVTTRYRLLADARYITIETELVNGGDSLASFGAGDSVEWGETRHFSPGFGFDISGMTTQTEWLGGVGAVTSYGYTTGALSVPATHGGNWSDFTVIDDGFGPGESVTFTRFFAVGEPDLASVSDVLHEVRGRPVGLVVGAITDHDSGAPIDGAVLDCTIYDVAPYTQMTSDSAGVFSATLPPATYVVEVAMGGYLPGGEFFTVSEHETTTIAIELDEFGSSAWQADTLTVVMRPILSVPSIVEDGGSFTIEAMAPPATTDDWSASIVHGGTASALTITDATYETNFGRWFVTATVPEDTPAELYDLIVTAQPDIADTVVNAVAVRHEIDDDFYFIQVTDTHLPTHKYYYQSGAATDTSEMVDFREVIEDMSIINPAFVLHTGDLINEGELEDYLDRRYYTKAKRILGESEVPMYVVAGNHDVGGWGGTPPSDGTARREWWRFFGWRYLNDPPPGDGLYTQNYTFDYGGTHFVGIEAYDNYDSWRYNIYGPESFTDLQMAWLIDDLSHVSPTTPTVAFYHYDFGYELDPGALGIDCALWGHVHYTSGGIANPPFDLSTAACCDGGRWYRLVRVSGNTITPSTPVSAGSQGQNLRVSYYPENDGLSSTVEATLVNNHPLEFGDALVKFRVLADSLPYEVDYGEIEQTIMDGDVATCYVKAPLAASSETTVTISPSHDPGGDPSSFRIALRQSYPNPVRSGATIRFVLPSRAEARLDIHDIAGRHVRALGGRVFDAGSNNRVTWDLRNDRGQEVASGIYFYRLTVGEESITRKMVVIR